MDSVSVPIVTSNSLSQDWPPPDHPPSSTSPISHNNVLQVRSKVTRSRPAYCHNHGLHVHLQSHWLMAFKCIPNRPWSGPPSASPTRSIMASNFAQRWPLGLSAHRLDHSLQVCALIASKCISKLAQSQPPSAISVCTRSQPPSVSPNILNHSLQVFMIMASKCMSNLAQSRPPECFSKFTRCPSSGSPQIHPKHRL